MTRPRHRRAPLRLEQHERSPAASGGAEVLTLTRADRLERAFGLRGGADGNVVSRGARIVWRGFARGDAPADGPIVTADGALYLGRARARAGGGPNDARLLVSGANGAVDEEASLGISRRHLCLSITSGRLVLFCESELGVRGCDTFISRRAAVVQQDGDRVRLQPKGPTALDLTVHFEAQHGAVEALTITRVSNDEAAR